MKTVGETLQSVRIKQGLSLEDVAKITKIKSEFLQAIEIGEFSQLPSPVAVQGFITSYAEVLGIEAKTVLSLLRRDYAVTRSSVVPKHLADPGQQKKRRKSNIRFGIVLAVLVLIMTLGYIGWSYIQLNKPPRLVVSSPKNGQTVKTTFVVKGWTASDAGLEIDTQPVSLTQDGEFAQEVTLTPGEHTITVVASNRKNQETIEQLFIRVE
jgi:cytoskeletal protein RodZ